MSDLMSHARAELERIGQFDEDPEYAESLVAAVEGFSSYGHSGGSAGCAVAQLERLLRYQPLAPLTDDPEEWMDVEEDIAGNATTWQSRRQHSCFSKDGGRTYYDIDERQSWWRRVATKAPVLRRRRWEQVHRSQECAE